MTPTELHIASAFFAYFPHATDVCLLPDYDAETLAVSVAFPDAPSRSYLCAASSDDDFFVFASDADLHPITIPFPPE